MPATVLLQYSGPAGQLPHELRVPHAGAAPVALSSLPAVKAFPRHQPEQLVGDGKGRKERSCESRPVQQVSFFATLLDIFSRKNGPDNA